MRTSRRPLTLAALALTATAGLTLSACRTSVSTNVDAAGLTQEVSSTAAGGAHTPTRTHAAPSSTTSPTAPDAGTVTTDATADDTTADGEDLPEPGYGITGNEGLCQAEAGWYGYAGLTLIGASADDQVWPDEIVPVLEQLRDAPTAHEDADPDLVDAASDLSYATDEVITEITSGADAAQAMGELDDPANALLDGCIAAGVPV